MSLLSVIDRIAQIEAMLGQAAPAAKATAVTSTPSTTASSFESALAQASTTGRSSTTSTDAATQSSAVSSTATDTSVTVPDSLQDVPYAAQIVAAAKKYAVDPDLVRAVIEHESGFDRNATSPVGAQGLMQLMPGTAKGLGVSDPYDPAQSIDGGTHFLADLLKRFNGDVRLALAAYDAGPGAVERYGGVPPYAETQQYVTWVMNRLDQLKAAETQTTERSSS
jgi:soluble lytic murein transglycosylase-like protein